MTVVARLTAFLNADTAAFESGMKRAASAMLSFGNVTKAVVQGEVISKAFDKATEALKSLTIGQMEAIGVNAKMAQSLGIGTQSLSAMSLLARESGTNMDALGMAMGRMQKTIYNASIGNQAAADALKNIGINVKDIIGLSPDKQFEKIAAALSKVENPTLRNGAAMAIFSRNARQIVNIFDDYTKRLADAKAFQDKFNIAVNEIDSQKVVQANEAFARAKDALGGIANTVVVEVAPAIEGVSKDLIAMGYDKDVFAHGVETTMTYVAALAESVSHAFMGVRLEFQSLKMIAHDIEALADNHFRSVGNGPFQVPPDLAAAANPNFKKDQFRGDLDRRAMANMLDENDKQWDPSQSFGRRLAQYQAASAAESAAWAKAHPAPVGGGLPAGFGSGAAQKALEEALARQKSLLKSIVGPALELTQTMADLNLLYKDGKLTSEQYNAALAKIKLQMAELDKTEAGGFAAGLLKIKMQMVDVGNVAEESIVSSFNEITGPAKKLQVTMDALNVLFSKNMITARQYGDAMLSAKIAMAELDKTAEGGFTAGMLKVQQQFSDVSSLAENMVTNSFAKAEDALVAFATTGKLSVKDMVNSMISDLARLEIRQSIEAPLFNALSGVLGLGSGANGGNGSVINWNQGGSSDITGVGGLMPSFAVGIDYVPHDMIAQIHKGERIVPASENGAAASQPSGPVFNVDMRGASVEAVARLEALVRQVNGSIETRAVSAVQQMTMRSTTFLRQ